MEALVVEPTTISATVVTDHHRAPNRRIRPNEKSLLKMKNWVNNTGLKLEDKVSLAHSRAAFLQGIVVFVGAVHFDKGIWVGIQLTGPSMGQGDCNGVCRGRRYFANVGRKNGIMVPIEQVNKRQDTKLDLLPVVESKTEKDERLKKKCQEIVANLQHIHKLFRKRASAMTKFLDEIEETGIAKRFRVLRRSSLIGSFDRCDSSSLSMARSFKYAKPGSELCKPDMIFVEELEREKQNFCLSNPTLPDNPIVFASSSFLMMCKCDLNECLGRNWRFLYGTFTDIGHLSGVRQAVRSGNDYTVCMVNYRKNGEAFYNQWKVTTLRDTKGRVKNFLVLHCEVPNPVLAKKINKTLGETPPTLPQESIKKPRRRASTGFVPKVSKDISLVPWYDLQIAPPEKTKKASRRASMSTVSSAIRGTSHQQRCSLEESPLQSKKIKKKTKRERRSSMPSTQQQSAKEASTSKTLNGEAVVLQFQSPNPRPRKKKLSKLAEDSSQDNPTRQSPEIVELSNSFENLRQMSFASIRTEEWDNSPPRQCRARKKDVSRAKK